VGNPQDTTGLSPLPYPYKILNVTQKQVRKYQLGSTSMEAHRCSSPTPVPEPAELRTALFPLRQTGTEPSRTLFASSGSTVSLACPSAHPSTQHRKVLSTTNVSYFSDDLHSLHFPSVFWHCWLGDRKGIRPVQRLGVCLLMVMIWLELCATYSSSCHHRFCHPLLQ